MDEIVPGIFAWDWLSPRFGYHFHGFFVPHPTGNLAIDPVEMPDLVCDELSQHGISRIVLTNRNHFRDAARLRARTGARVAVHPADAGFVREKGVAVDDALEPGQKLGPFEVLAVPGKSPGEVALCWPERRLLLVGDACVGPKPGVLGLLPDQVIDDRPQLEKSLAELLRRDFDTLLLADGYHLLAGGHAALERLVGSWRS